MFIGWDVGGWNCDKNPTSRDALVVLDAAGTKIGQPWRGNLRLTINAATTGTDFLTAILALCKLPPPARKHSQSHNRHRRPARLSRRLCAIDHRRRAAGPDRPVL